MMASVLSAGQEISFCQRNSGPINHLEEDLFLFAPNPRETSSAGFILGRTISSLRDIAALMYLGYFVSNKYLERLGIIVYVAQYHVTVFSKGLILPFSI